MGEAGTDHQTTMVSHSGNDGLDLLRVAAFAIMATMAVHASTVSALYPETGSCSAMGMENVNVTLATATAIMGTLVPTALSGVVLNGTNACVTIRASAARLARSVEHSQLQTTKMRSGGLAMGCWNTTLSTQHLIVDMQWPTLQMTLQHEI